jgi:hypothetical protein
MRVLLILAPLMILAGCTSEPKAELAVNPRYEQAHTICQGLKVDETPNPDGTPSKNMQRCICYYSADWSSCDREAS